MESVQSILQIDAMNLHYRDLNEKLREAVKSGIEHIELHNISGQRYLGTDLHRPVQIDATDAVGVTGGTGLVGRFQFGNRTVRQHHR